MCSLQAVLVIDPNFSNIDVKSKSFFFQRKNFARYSRVLVVTELFVSGT